ncbi:MAG: polysaccharide pyruvyl transferase family protein [Clostridia bacterium]|jgi:putative sterol carrier protein|nr:polysaccharide pyruvyl transferase family protein [Clostridia bacterium]
MKKIAIVTINDTNNYGNRLQNYALQEFIKRFGFECETIYFKQKKMERIKTVVKNFIKFFLPTWHTKRIKEIRFKKFNEKYISQKGKNDKELGVAKNQYDYFIVGSDQVWNYTYMKELEKYFLPYAKYEQSISYAASFGVSIIEEKYKQTVKNGINNIKYLSTREERGREIIKELTNREAEVLVDPTLLMSRKEWQNIEIKPKHFEVKKYILLYFLGENEYIDEIKDIARKYKLELIDITNIKQRKYYTFNPNEFVYLFNNAELIYTDSFHACVFSIIFNKPFFVFDRKQKDVKSMNSRLDTLLKMFGQERRKIDKIVDNEEIFNCNYINSKEILEKERERSKEFLKKIFE